MRKFLTKSLPNELWMQYDQANANRQYSCGLFASYFIIAPSTNYLMIQSELRGDLHSK